MSEEQIATALGQIMGKLDSLHSEFRDYKLDHGDRHKTIDATLNDHSAHINQQRGAKALLLALAGVVSAVIAYIGKKVL